MVSAVFDCCCQCCWLGWDFLIRSQPASDCLTCSASTLGGWLTKGNELLGTRVSATSHFCVHRHSDLYYFIIKYQIFSEPRASQSLTFTYPRIVRFSENLLPNFFLFFSNENLSVCYSHPTAFYLFGFSELAEYVYFQPIIRIRLQVQPFYLSIRSQFISSLLAFSHWLMWATVSYLSRPSSCLTQR